MPHKDKYRCFSELKRYETAAAYKIVSQDRGSDILVLAPHGGGIEPRTSAVARAIAADDYSLYLFEGEKDRCNYSTLHITSARFDEPTCIAMLAQARVALAIHGCRGESERIYVGGLDEALGKELATGLRKAEFDVLEDGHDFPGVSKNNVCNRTSSGRGCQLELTRGFRERADLDAFVNTVRAVLATVAE